MFPLPGAPRTQPMDPSRLQAFMNQPAGSATASALKPSNARQAKRLIVKNLPASATNQSLVDFFNLQLNGLNVVSGPDPCLSSHISNDRIFALVEFKSAEDATFTLAMDGISMEDNDAMDTSNGMHNGDQSGLKVRRPKDYIVPTKDEEEEPEAGVIATKVQDSHDKISIAHIPTYLEEAQVIELLVAFGEVKAFTLAKDIHTEQSRVRRFLTLIEYPLTLAGHCLLRIH
jgi:splicing factor U2AF subunit